jgi:anti-sigma regulatory factor (Ser/Thr protein kinase)
MLESPAARLIDVDSQEAFVASRPVLPAVVAWSGRFEPSPDTVASVRHTLEAHLERVSPTCREIALLVASELATNAVRHARTPYDVRVCVGQCVSIEVTDTGPGTAVLRPAPDGDGGRGLHLVSALAMAWGVEHRSGAKTVWAEVPVDS